MPRVSPQKPLGVEMRPRRLLFRPGNSQERLVLEKAQGLQPDCWQPFDHSSESLSMGWPWGRGLLWGDCLMICQQRTRQTDFWQLPGCNRRVDFYSHPRCSLQAGDKRKRQGWCCESQGGIAILDSAFPWVSVDGAWISWHWCLLVFHPLNILVIANSSIPWAPGNCRVRYGCGLLGQRFEHHREWNNKREKKSLSLFLRNFLQKMYEMGK